MRNLWVFILKHNAFFLFVLFEVLAVLLIVRNNQYQKARVFNATNDLVGRIYKQANAVSDYLVLGRINDSLAAENARLHGLLPNTWRDTVARKITVMDTLGTRRYSYIPAKVVNNTVTLPNNYITLDRGSKHRVRSGMGVIGANGIVGIVDNVSEHFCRVSSVLHREVKISVKLDEEGTIGSLVWPGGDPRTAALEDIPSHVKVREGESISTTGYSLFPENIPVGKVRSVAAEATQGFLGIEVDLNTTFHQLEYVYIVVDKFRDEQQAIEKEEDNP